MLYIFSLLNFPAACQTMNPARRFLCAGLVLVWLVPDSFEVQAAFSQAMDSDFTLTLPAGRKECFYQTMKRDASLEIEYQVSDVFRVPFLEKSLLTFFFRTRVMSCSVDGSSCVLAVQSQIMFSDSPCHFLLLVTCFDLEVQIKRNFPGIILTPKKRLISVVPS